jgi:predicted MFS family arabinose efflux permease
MKVSTVKLLIPMVAVSIQANSATTVIPPYLDHMHIPVALIGTLISLGPVLALLSRLPVGMAYNHQRARLVISAMIAMGITNYLYGFASGPMTFAVVQGINGFAYGAITTLYMAFYVDSLAPDENRNHAMATMSAAWRWDIQRAIFWRSGGGPFGLRGDISAWSVVVVGRRRIDPAFS